MARAALCRVCGRGVRRGGGGAARRAAMVRGGGACQRGGGAGRPAEVIGVLESEIATEPFRERIRAVLMLALARAGRPVEALRAFDAYRSFLADEVGVVPSAALQELNDDILRQHPDLGWRGPHDRPRRPASCRPER